MDMGVLGNNKVHDYMYYEGEETRPAEPGPNFHGECWHVCPWCKKEFEFWDAYFERGFQKIEDGLYRHDCGRLVTVI